VDDYLCGVLGPEIGDDAPPAALRAQAIVARSFALFRVLHRPRSPHYHLVATTTDQVYRGQDRESGSVRKAVDDTKGWLLAVGGDVVDATYHDTSGGTTAEPEVLWGGPVAGVVSVFDGAGTCPSLAEESAAREFLLHPPSSTYGHSSPVFRWRVRYSAAELTAALAETLPAARIGRLTDVTVGQRSASGRVGRLTFVGSDASASVHGDAIRWVFGGARCQPLRSTLVAVDKEGQALPHPAYEFFGGGWGHGAGLSQTGAIEMARAGADHPAILHHYYPASQLVRVPDPGAP
jgi:SpoIID/LytB domain protein